MTPQGFMVGTRFNMRGATFRIRNILDDNIIQYINTVNGSIREKPIGDLNKKFMAGALELLPDTSEISFTRKAEQTPHAIASLYGVEKRDVDYAVWKHQILTNIIEHKAETVPAQQSCKELTLVRRQELQQIDPNRKLPSNSTLAKWMKRFQLHGKVVESLVPRTMLRGRPGHRLDSDVERIISDEIDKTFLTKKRKSIKKVYIRVKTAIDQHNRYHGTDLKVPSRATVYRRIQELIPYVRMKRRKGKEKADRMFRCVTKRVDLNYPLERIEIDNTPLNVFVLDDETLKPINRPILTLAIDCYSRMIMGFAISIGGANLESIYDAIRMSILPKDWLKQKYPDIEKEWPAYGVGMQYVFDNGSEYFSKSLRQAMLELGADVSFIPRRTPHLRGKVERVQRTINDDLIAELDGKSFESIESRGDYNSVDDAKLTLTQLEELITKWIVTVYHHSVHRGLGKKPINAWYERQEAFVPRLPQSIHHLDLTLSHYKKRTLSHKGIEINGIFYNNALMGELRKQRGHTMKVMVRFSQYDLTKIFVGIPDTSEFLTVEAINADELIGLSLREWKLIRKQRLKANHEEMAGRRAALADEASEMAKSTSLRKRTQSARLRDEQKKAQKKQGTKKKAPVPVLKPEILIRFQKGES